ncbi:ATP-binding cassette domain-containing protein, partial [Pectinatus frisingensis]
RIAIIGRNKAGKSSFLDQLAAQALSGFYAQNLRITYFKQDQADLEPDQTAVELISRQSSQDRVTILNYLAMMGIDYDKANQKVAVLSGGERVRLALVAALLTDHQL